MIVLAIDPGSKPGAAVIGEGGLVLRASHRLEDINQWQSEVLWTRTTGTPDWPLVATEGQWYYGPRGADRSTVDVNDLLKLAFRAGWQLRGVPAQRHLRIPPQAWRGASSANKVQMQKRILRDLTPQERRLFLGVPESRHGDILDSIGIGKFALRIAHTTTEYDYK